MHGTLIHREILKFLIVVDMIICSFVKKISVCVLLKMDLEVEYLDDSYFENLFESVNSEINNCDVEVNVVDGIKRKKKAGIGLNANKRVKKTDFTTEEKKMLCMLVAKQRRIWNLEDEMHKNVNAIASSWKEISLNMKKSGKY